MFALLEKAQVSFSLIFFITIKDGGDQSNFKLAVARNMILSNPKLKTFDFVNFFEIQKMFKITKEKFCKKVQI